MERKKELPMVEGQGCCEPICGPTTCGGSEPMEKGKGVKA